MSAAPAGPPGFSFAPSLPSSATSGPGIFEQTQSQAMGDIIFGNGDTFVQKLIRDAALAVGVALIVRMVVKKK